MSDPSYVIRRCRECHADSKVHVNVLPTVVEVKCECGAEYELERFERY